MNRKNELSANLVAVRERVDAACVAASRQPAEVEIITVTKTYPASDIALLAELGVHDIGESRDQEATAKFAECASLGLRWHFIGQFQTNKASRIAKYADIVHSIDRVPAADALSRAALRAERLITALVQVSLDSQPSTGRAGASADEFLRVAEAIAHSPSLRLGGVMAVAPLIEPAAAAFERLSVLVARLQSAFPEAQMVSAGMSDDLVEAVAHGATHLRIGSAIMGSRSYVQ
jgi:hypothetical protein